MRYINFSFFILISVCTTSVKCGQTASRPIRRPEDLLKQEVRDALYAERARRQQAMRKNLLEEKPAFFTTPRGYKIPLQQAPKETISESSSVDNFYQEDAPTLPHSPTQESSLTIDTSNSAIAHIILPTETIVATPSTKRDLSPLRSDDFLGNADDNEDRLDSPESEQQKRSRPEAFQEMPSDLAFINDLLNQEVIHHMLND